MEAHIDDVCLGTNTPEDDLILLCEFFAVWQDNDTRLKLEKSEYMQETVHSQICSYCDFLYVDTLSFFSPWTAALHVVDGILNFLFLHCGYLEALV